MNSGFIGWFFGGGARTLKHTVGIFITETASFPSVSSDVKSTSWEFTQNPLILKDYNESSKQGNWNPFHPKSFFGMVNKQPSQKGLKSHGSHVYPSGLVWYNVLRSEVWINMALQGPHPPQKNCKLAPCPSQKAKNLG